MKIEHRAIIERAQLHGCMPSEIASELLEHDLINMVIDQIPNYRDWSENTQQLTIERVTLEVKKAVHVAIRTIAARGRVEIPVDIKRVQVDAKNLTVVAIVDGKDPKKHDLVDHAGHLCLLVMSPDDYNEGLDAITSDRDQKDLPLHVGDLIDGMFPDHPLGTADELAERTGEQVPGNDDDLVDAGEPGDWVKEFGEFTYDEAAQLIVVKSANGRFEAAWVQSRLAIDSDKATSLLLQLLDNGVIALESEGPTTLEHSYKVIATLEDVT